MSLPIQNLRFYVRILLINSNLKSLKPNLKCLIHNYSTFEAWMISGCQHFRIISQLAPECCEWLKNYWTIGDCFCPHCSNDCHLTCNLNYPKSRDQNQQLATFSIGLFSLTLDGITCENNNCNNNWMITSDMQWGRVTYGCLQIECILSNVIMCYQILARNVVSHIYPYSLSI